MKSPSPIIRASKRCHLPRAGRNLPGSLPAPRARAARVALTAFLLEIAIALTAAPALAQQPAASPAPAPLNPNWCSDVPASPPPPHYENIPGEWAARRKMCLNATGHLAWKTCGDICLRARELWQRAKEGTLDQPSTFPPATDKLQTPLPVPGGGSGYPLPPTPAAATPVAPESFAAPAARSPGPAPAGSLSGADISATGDLKPTDSENLLSSP